MKHPPKTIHKRRMRKLNPELIDRQFAYMSEEFEVNAWVDVQDGDIETATAELIEYVDSELSADIEKAVQHLRKVARSRLFHEDAIKSAFAVLMSTQNADQETIEIATERFIEFLQVEQSKMY